MSDRKLYVRAAEVPECLAHLFTPGKVYALRPKFPGELFGGYIVHDEGREVCILAGHDAQCAFLLGTAARWEIVDADGNPVTPETEQQP